MNAPEYRRCPLTGRTVIFAPERASRPITLAHAAPHHRDDDAIRDCPFCPGNEHDTPAELFAQHDDGEWQLRVVGNKFPAVRPNAPAYGEHEVLIDCRAHYSQPTQMSAGQLASVFLAYRDRIRVHLANPRIEQVTVFKNVGAEAGASLAHAHSQIVALPFVPPALQRELTAATHYRQTHGRCFFCDELQAEERRIVRTQQFTALCPFAARSAYEIMILPNAHDGRFENIDTSAALELAELLLPLLSALDDRLARPAYNWYIHSLPRADGEFHWHLAIIPRTARAAGFEWSSGIFINDTLPEIAAQQLRS